MGYNNSYRAFAQKMEEERTAKAVAKRDALKAILENTTKDDEKAALEYAIYLIERMHSLRSFTQEEVFHFENL